MSREVAIAAAVVAAIEDHAMRDRPLECCGLLLGTAAAIVEAVPAANVAERPAVRYVVDPAAHFAAMRAARARGLDVVGGYHSHVLSPPRPSAVDRAEAFQDFLFLIVSLMEPGRPAIAAWELEAGNFVPVSLVRTA